MQVLIIINSILNFIYAKRRWTKSNWLIHGSKSRKFSITTLSSQMLMSNSDSILVSISNPVRKKISWFTRTFMRTTKSYWMKTWNIFYVNSRACKSNNLMNSMLTSWIITKLISMTSTSSKLPRSWCATVILMHSRGQWLKWELQRKQMDI